MRRPIVALALVAPLLAGCMPTPLHTDLPGPRPGGVRGALAALVGACDAPRTGDAGTAAGTGRRAPAGEERRESPRCDEARDAKDGPAPAPAGPTQKKP